MAALRTLAPGANIETCPLPADEIADALDRGGIDFAFGFLPTVKDTQRDHLLTDRYVVLLRAQHPFALAFNRSRRQPAALLESLHELEFVAVRSHSDTLRILQMLNLESGLRLTTAHSWRCPPSSRLCRCGISRCRFTRAGASSRTLAIAGCARRW